MKIDLNSDLGESFGRYTIGCDEQVVPLVTSINAACGFHAGDPLVMKKTIQLVHISQISKKRIKHPSDVLKVGDVVNVRILNVDVEKNRISLTMKF